MKSFKKLLLLISLVVIPVGNALAAERTATGVLTSNYVFRGQTQTDKKPAIQATYHASQFKDLGWYAGLFASNVQFGAEVDLYGGWRAPFGKNKEFAFDIGAVEYLYTDDRFAPTNHEFYTGISYQTSYFRYFIGEENTSYFDLGTSFFVLDEFSLDLHYGRTSGLFNDGNDIGATLRKDIKGFMVAVAMTYEDLAPTNEFEFFVSITKEFGLSKR
jgi:uncharacterized protein (TIGR02001 family)